MNSLNGGRADPKGSSKTGISLGVVLTRDEGDGALCPMWVTHWILDALGNVCDLGQGGSLQSRLFLLKLTFKSFGSTVGSTLCSILPEEESGWWHISIKLQLS